LDAHPRCRMGSFGPSVSSTNDDHIKMFHVKHSLLAQAKAGKHLIENILDINAANQHVQCFKRDA
jgi:hypothetical protein